MAQCEDIGNNRAIACLQFFTGREEERQLMKRFFENIMHQEKSVKVPILHIYGVGGAGKSSLLKKVMEEWYEETAGKTGRGLTGSKKTPTQCLKIALVDFDTAEVERNYTSADALWDIRSALARSGMMMCYFDALYVLYWKKTRGSEKLDISQFKNIFDTDNESTKSITLAKDFVSFFSKLRGNKAIKDIASQLGFDDLARIEEKIADDILEIMLETFGLELAHVLEEQDISLVLVMDGFERIHKNKVLEKSIRELVRVISLDEGEMPSSRVGTLILARQQLKWHGKLKTGCWENFIESHYLGGLEESDARDVLNKAIAFEHDANNSIVAHNIKNHTPDILLACRDIAFGSKTENKLPTYHPYTIDLAIRVVRERGDKFDVNKHLGDSPKELQKRFITYMDSTEKRLYLILAIVLRFDWSTIKALTDKKLIFNLDKTAFHRFIAKNSYIIEYAGKQGLYRLHHLMQDALVDDCKEAGNDTAKTILTNLLTLFCEPLNDIGWYDNISLDQENNFFHALDITFMALEEGLYSLEEFDTEKAPLPEMFYHEYYLQRADYLRRYLSLVKGKYGDKSFSVMRALYNLASVYELENNYSDAKALYREALDIRRELLDDKFTYVENILNALVRISYYQWFDIDIEAVSRELLEIRLELLGDQHPSIADSRSNLAAVLFSLGKGTEN